MVTQAVRKEPPALTPISVNSEQFKKAVEALGKALGLAPHGDHATTLRAADKYVAYVVQSGARQRHIAYADEVIVFWFNVPRHSRQPIFG